MACLRRAFLEIFFEKKLDSFNELNSHGKEPIGQGDLSKKREIVRTWPNCAN